MGALKRVSPVADIIMSAMDDAGFLTAAPDVAKQRAGYGGTA